MQQYSLPLLKKPYKPLKENIRHSLDTSSYIKITKHTSEETSFANYVLKKQQELELAMQQVIQQPQIKNSFSRHLPKIQEQQKTSPYLIRALVKNRYPTEPIEQKKEIDQMKSMDIPNHNKLAFEKFSINSLVRQQCRKVRASPNRKLFTSVQ
ncbi:unnamed protein product [Paramecium sonneborni]|uniref:Uncharacterized protein n=1 Tax=Paramecium sonneborni TaxID=65129 RepID=A0A8S1QRK6_9CILI|nr:unnamed protein product [Paramecium sonneborni]